MRSWRRDVLTARTIPLAIAAAVLWAAPLRAAPPEEGTPAGTAVDGDPRRGEALYVGSARFQNRGAPCLACHGVAGRGLARAASFGPDLTAAHAAWGGGAALESMLADMPFPSMQPIYASQALTPIERRDLVAFMAETAERDPPRLGVAFSAGVAAAMAGFLLLFRAIGRRRPSRSHPSHPLER